MPRARLSRANFWASVEAVSQHFFDAACTLDHSVHFAIEAPLSKTLSPLSLSPIATTVYAIETTLLRRLLLTRTRSIMIALSKKQQAHAAAIHRTPFPQWLHPTPQEAQQVCDLLASVHGLPQRPKVLVDRPDGPAGCGNVPSVLDALVRTILSANTTSKNSTAAKVSMDNVYGRANYRAVLEGGPAKLEDCIRCGGLAQNKSKAIVNILQRLEHRNVSELGLEPGKGELSLDWLHELSDEAAMNELISYDSVGIKTASCVLLFCLGRDSFAVDTYVAPPPLSLFAL